MKEKSIKQQFIKYVSLNIMGMIGMSCYILADTLFIARGVGANGLAALNLVLPIYSLIHGLGLMLGLGGATRFAISKTKESYSLAIIFTLIASALFMLLGLFFSHPLAFIFGANTETINNASTYLKIILLFAPMFLLNNVVICFVRNDRNPQLAMNAMLFGSLANIVLDYIFIFPLEMGMFGAALATGIAPIISLIILSTHFKKLTNTLELTKVNLNIDAFFDMSRLGLSALIMELSSGIVMITFNMIILRLAGNQGVAAYGIIANIALVVISIFSGISQGIQPLLSMSHRENNTTNTTLILKYSFITALSIAIITYISFYIYARDIVSLFNKDKDIALSLIAMDGLRLYFTSFMFVGINILCATYFSATDQPKNAFIISITRGFIIIIPLAFVLSSLYGINGTWLAVPLSELIVLFISITLINQSPYLKT